jgi:hypothetical protein
MFDHIGVVVSDFAKSKVFYTQALAPIGHSRVAEIMVDGGLKPSASFCHEDGSDLWISRANRRARCTWRSVRARAQRWMRSMQQRWLRAAGTTASQACARDTTQTTTALMCWIRMATTSRPSVTTRLPPRDRCCTTLPRPRPSYHTGHQGLGVPG